MKPKSNTKPAAPTEADGIKAIIFLQSLAGIDETEDSARAGWRSLSDHDKQRTMDIYDMLAVYLK